MAFPRALKAGNYSKPNQEGLGPERWVRGGLGTGPRSGFLLPTPSSQQRLRARGLQPLFPRAAGPSPPPSSRAAPASSRKELRTVEETNPAG